MTPTSYNSYIIPTRANNTWVTWGETLVITFLALILGYFFSPQDPFLLDADFPWMLFAPLLVAVRYGLLPSMLSVGCILIIVVLTTGSQQSALPINYMVGIVLATFLVGEFRDLWLKKIIMLQRANEYRQYRLDDFTRSHRLLQVSHDNLELRVAGGKRSLRNILQGLRSNLSTVEVSQQAKLNEIAEQAMQIFIEHASFTSATLYQVTSNKEVSSTALSSIGNMPQVSTDDILFTACLKTKQTVSVRDELLDRADNPSQLKVCVPLLDTEQNWVGILAIAKLPFFSLTDQTLNLLTLLAGYIADTVYIDHKVLKLVDSKSQIFSQHLKRSIIISNNNKLDAALCAFEITKSNPQLQSVLESSQRGLDLQLELINSRDHYTLLVLLPLTSNRNVESYLERIYALVAQQFPDMNLNRLGVKVYTCQLNHVKPTVVTNFLYQKCGLNEQQVVI